MPFAVYDCMRISSLITLFSVFAVSLPSYSAPLCSGIFGESGGRPLSQMNKPVLEIFPDFKTALKAQFIELQKPDERYEFARTHLKDVKVEFKETTEKSILPFFKKQSVLEIATSGSSELNVLSKNLMDKYGVKLVYSPHFLEKSGTQGAFKSSTKTIYVSDYTGTTGQIDFVLLHEIRHAAMSSKEKKGKYPFFNGTMLKWPSAKWPWSTSSKSGYENYMNLQEVATWHQGHMYRLIAIRQFARSGEFTFANAKTQLKRIQKGTLDIYEDALALVNFHLEKSQTKSLSVSFKENVGITFGTLSLKHLSTQVVPMSFVENYLKANNISGTPSKEVRGKIVAAFLQEFKNDLEAMRSELQNSEIYIRFLQEKMTFLEARGSSIEEMRKDFLEVGRSTGRPSGLLTSNSKMSDYSAMSERGPDFSQLPKEVFQLKQKEFAPNENSAVVADAIWDDIVDHYVSAPFVRAEINLTLTGAQKTLVVETTSGALTDIRPYLELLANQGAQFQSIKIFKIEKSIQEADMTVPAIKEAQEFTAMNNVEVQARNIFRFYQLVEDHAR